MRKDNYVLFVKEMMPGDKLTRAAISSDCLFIIADEVCCLAGSEQKSVDKTHPSDIIILTGSGAPLVPQTRSASAAWRSQPESGRGKRRVVPAKRVLRSSRFGSGQIRDVAASASRGTAGERRSTSFRLFAPFLLSDPSRIRRKWCGWPAASQTRSERRAQADARGDGVRRAQARARSFAVLGRARPADSATLSDLDSRTQYRSTVGASKKTPVSAGNTLANPDPELAMAYEQLRNQVLGIDATRPRGPGLAVFLERGMKAWIEVYCRWKELTPPGCDKAAPQKHPSPLVQNDIVVLLTSMLLERARQEGG